MASRTGFKIQWKTGSQNYDPSRQKTECGFCLDTTITGLQSGTTYTVRVIAYNDDGDGPPSDEVTATTTGSPPSAGVTVSPATLNVDEDSWGYYTIVLDSAPAADVTIKLSRSGDRDIFVYPMKGSDIIFSSSVTFTPSDWSEAKRVGVMAVPDSDEDDGTATITHTATSSDSSYDNITIASVSVNEDDENKPVSGDCKWGYACAASDETPAPGTASDETPAPVSPAPVSSAPVSSTPVSIAGSTCSRQPTPGLESDCEALSDLYDETEGSEWSQSGNWLTESPLAQWHGVTVSGGRVTEVNLGGNNLSGEISDLGGLGNLKTLDLSDNEELGGELPLGLMNLLSLETLYVRCTEVTVPEDEGFEQWLDGIDFGEAGDCAGSADAEPQDDASAVEEEELSSGGGCAVSGRSGTGASAALGLLLTVSAVLSVFLGNRRKREKAR